MRAWWPRAGSHEGGYLPFEIDATSLLHAGENQVAVRVADPGAKPHEVVEGIRYAEIPHGKQNWYVQTSGLWQSVELDYRPRVRLGSRSHFRRSRRHLCHHRARHRGNRRRLGERHRRDPGPQRQERLEGRARSGRRGSERQAQRADPRPLCCGAPRSRIFTSCASRSVPETPPAAASASAASPRTTANSI